MPPSPKKGKKIEGDRREKECRFINEKQNIKF
jgi:hypothetical protein